MMASITKILRAWKRLLNSVTNGQQHQVPKQFSQQTIWQCSKTDRTLLHSQKDVYLMIEMASDLATPATELAHHESNQGNKDWKALESLVGHIKGKYF